MAVIECQIGPLPEKLSCSALFEGPDPDAQRCSMRERIRRVAEETIEEIAPRISCSPQAFDFLHDPMQAEDGSPILGIHLWFKGIDKGLYFEMRAAEDSTDESIKEESLRGLESELHRIGLGDRL